MRELFEFLVQWLQTLVCSSCAEEIAALRHDLRCADVIPYWPTVKEEAAKRAFDRFSMAGLIEGESAFYKYAVGDGGLSRGLLQVGWPAYQDVMGPQATETAWRRDTFKPHLCIAIGLDYLVQCRSLCVALGQPGLEWAMACYNWGKGNMKRHLEASGLWSQLPQEVQQHVAVYKTAADRFRQEVGSGE